MRDTPDRWEKENIRLFEEEAPDREFARVGAECASDSDLLRQSLRNTAQLVDDLEDGKALWVRRLDGASYELTPDLFRDPPSPIGTELRRSLILHHTSRDRINDLRERLGLEDVSAVARFALRFFYRIVREATAGATFRVVDQNGASTEVRFGTLS